jgi:dTDP-4-dehydrorhamnose reductase
MTFSHDILKRRILITGANGMLGQRITRFFINRKDVHLMTASLESEPVFSNIDFARFDITKREDVKNIIYDFYPDFIINAAGFTNVDRSEKERETAWKVNVKGVEYLSEGARVIDAHLINFSSDYIFDGKKGEYSERDKPNPLSYYGRTKLASENALKISGCYYTILRTNVLYGVAESRPDFVRWVIDKLNKGEEIKIVTDQINNPTFIDDISFLISKIIEFKKTGLYHIGGREFISRYNFALRIADYFGLNKNLIIPVTTEELNQSAKRPLKGGLLTLKAESELGYKPLSIDESLRIMKKELNL